MHFHYLTLAVTLLPHVSPLEKRLPAHLTG